MYLIKAFSLILCLLHIVASSQNRSFSVDYQNKQFLKDGKPFRYVSADMHWFRVPSAEWPDRIAKIKAAGLNAVQTYIQWNFHSPQEGVYDFEGDRDLEKFIQLVHDADLLLIIRGIPYTCAEWEFGGLPWWIKNSNAILRSKNPTWLGKVDAWMDVILPKLKPHLYVNGGPIIMIQVENEYGSYYINDDTYKENLVSKYREHLGPDVVLFTTDIDVLEFVQKGAVESQLATVDFGVTDDPAKNFEITREFNPNAPLVNSEFYTGWINHWGSPFAHVSATAFASSLDKVLALNASATLYIFVGGTNFEYWSGSNTGTNADLYSMTSYDFDAPVSESGDTTWKYFLIRDVIHKHFPSVEPIPVPANSSKAQLKNVKLESKGNLLAYTDILSNSAEFQKSVYPMNMEKYGFGYGFVLYRTKLTKDYEANSILQFAVNGVRDRATILVTSQDNNSAPVYLGTVDNILTAGASIRLTKSLEKDDYLNVVVENRGRVNYDKAMQNQTKGLNGNVTLNKEILTNWEALHLKLENLGSNEVSKTSSTDTVLPMVYQAEVEMDLYDSFLNTTSFSRGVALVDNYNLGRYWPTKGPQQTLFTPKAFRKSNKFLLTLVEFERGAMNSATVDFLDYPILDGPVN